MTFISLYSFVCRPWFILVINQIKNFCLSFRNNWAYSVDTLVGLLCYFVSLSTFSPSVPELRWGTLRRSPDYLVGWGGGHHLPIHFPLNAFRSRRLRRLRFPAGAGVSLLNSFRRRWLGIIRLYEDRSVKLSFDEVTASSSTFCYHFFGNMERIIKNTHKINR